MTDDELQSLIGGGVTAVVLIAAGVLMVWMARRSATDRLPRNPLAGIRTALTMASDDAWYAAQRAGASATLIGGVGTLLGGAIAGVAAMLLPGPTAIAVTSLGTAAWLLCWAFVGAVRGQRAARAVRGR